MEGCGLKTDFIETVCYREAWWMVKIVRGQLLRLCTDVVSTVRVGKVDCVDVDVGVVVVVDRDATSDEENIAKIV